MFVLFAHDHPIAIPFAAPRDLLSIFCCGWTALLPAGLNIVEAGDGLRDESLEDVVRQLHLDLCHEPLVGLPPLLLLLLVLHFHNFTANYFFYYLLLLLVVQDLPDLVLLGSCLGIVLGFLGMLDGAGTRVGPGEDVVLHLVQYFL